MSSQDFTGRDFDATLTGNTDPSLDFNSADLSWLEDVSPEDMAEFLRPFPTDDTVQPVEPQQPLVTQSTTVTPGVYQQINTQAPVVPPTIAQQPHVQQPVAAQPYHQHALSQQQRLFVPTNHPGMITQPLAAQPQAHLQARAMVNAPTTGPTAPFNGNASAFSMASSNGFWSKIEAATQEMTAILRYNSFDESERNRTMKVNKKRKALQPEDDETFPKTTAQIKSYVALVHRVLVAAPTNLDSASAESKRQWTALSTQLKCNPPELPEQASWEIVKEIMLSRKLGARDHKKAVNAPVHNTMYSQVKAVCDVLRENKAIASGVSVQFWCRLVRLVDSPESVVKRSKLNLRQNAERAGFLAEKRAQKAENAKASQQAQKKQKRTLDDFEFEDDFDDDNEQPQPNAKRPATQAAYHDLNHESSTNPGSPVFHGIGLYDTPSPSPERLLLNSGVPGSVAAQHCDAMDQDLEQYFQS